MEVAFRGHESMVYHFDIYELDPARRELRSGGEPVKLEPQVYALLEMLIRHHGEIVTKSDINREIWHGREVSESAISSRIRSARLAIGDNGTAQRMIKTIPNQGFCFVGRVETEEHAPVQTQTDAIPTTAVKAPSLAHSNVAPPVLEGAPAARFGEGVLRPVMFVCGGLMLIGLMVFGFASMQSTNHTPDGAASLAATQTISDDERRSRALNTIPISDNSIAVLPFSDMSGTRDQQYFADGIAEEILNYLAAHQDIKVASRTSAFSFREKDVRIDDIGKALGVQYVLEGSVRRAGSSLRITAQLIDSKNDRHIWSRTYDRPFTEETVIITQEEIAREIVAEISSHLGVTPVMISDSTNSFQAKEAFLRGNAYQYARTSEGLDNAIAAYKKAIALDPDYLEAYTALAQTYALTHRYQNRPQAEVVAVMRSMIRQASDIRADHQGIYVANAALALLERRFADAIRYSDKANAISPNYTVAQKYKADALQKLGRYEEAVTIYEEALTRDALSPDLLNALAEARIYIGDVDGALEAALANLHWNPKSAAALDMSSFLFWNQGNYKRTHEILKMAHALTPDDIYVSSDLIYLYIDLGMPEEAKKYASSANNKAFYYVLTDQPEKARAAFAQIANPFEHDEVAYLLRDYETAAAIMGSIVEAEGLNDTMPPRMTDGDWLTKVCFVYRQVSHPDAGQICDKLSGFYGGKSPEDFPMIEDVFGGAAWHMINDNHDAALAWIDYLLEQEMAFLKLTTQPVFAPLQNDPGYISRLEKIKENAAHQQQVIYPDVVQL